MRLLRGLVVALIAVAVVLLGVAFVLPTEIKITRDIIIAAPPEKVFANLNALQKAARWSPWITGDAAIKLSYAGPPEGVGNRMVWSSGNPEVGNGSQEIIVSLTNQRVESALDVGGMGVATAWQALRLEKNGTRVTWGLLADTGNSPLRRYRGFLASRRVGAEVDAGLARLKALTEAESLPAGKG